MAVTEYKKQALSGTQAAGASRFAGRLRAADIVIDALQSLCETLGAGGRVPTHTELMRRFGASERAVRGALDELQRSGRIVRRHGSGTFVTEAVASVGSGAASPALPTSLVDARAIVAVAPPDHSFFDQSVSLFCRHAEASDLSPVCKPVRDISESYLAELGQTLSAAKVAGFIVFSTRLESLANRLQKSGARVVLFGTPHVDAAPAYVPIVYGDQEFGGYLLTRHLLDLGHRRIANAVVGDDGRMLRRSLRWQGQQRALAAARRRGIAAVNPVLSEEIRQWQADPARAAAFLRSPGAPTALICWNDHEAVKLLSILNRAGVKVPDEVSLTGYDDLPEGRIAFPPLTTVDPSLDHLVRVSVDLITRPESAPSARTVLVPTLVPRESTAPPPPDPASPSDTPREELWT